MSYKHSKNGNRKYQDLKTIKHMMTDPFGNCLSYMTVVHTKVKKFVQWLMVVIVPQVGSVVGKDGFILDPDNWWDTVLRMVDRISAEDPRNAKLCSPPNFISPFTDPDIIRKLKEDRRASAWLGDAEFMALLVKLKETPGSIDEHFYDHKFHSKILTTLQILVFGKEGYATHDERPRPPPGVGTMPYQIIGVWVGILFYEQIGWASKAKKEKEAGNEAYKVRDFDKALMHYSKAAKLHPTDMTFQLNIGAVYYESKRYSDCINECLEAIQVGQENSAQFRVLSKAYLRIGKSYRQLGDYQSAKVFYKKSLTQSSSPEVVSLLAEVEVEKLIVEQERSSHEAHSVVMNAKQHGNELFRKGEYAAAEKFYTKAIALDSEEAKLYSNRAACYLKLSKLDLAMEDCEKSLQLQPKNAQGWLMKTLIMDMKISIAFEVMKSNSSSVETERDYEESLETINNALENLVVD